MIITVPDTLNGAFILSFIDFFLSFVVISFIGVVLAAFPLLNQAGPGVAAKIQQQPEPVETDEPVDMTADDHIAAISAAMAALIGAHRIIHIEPAYPAGWLAEGRVAHHTSHAVAHHPHAPSKPDSPA